MPKKDYSFTGYQPLLEKKARSLRKAMTDQERRLWYCFLREYPVKFYRQRAIDRFIVDFYCSKARLVIELDGSQHYTAEGQQYDSLRTEVLERYDLEVLRFSNLDISDRFEGVCTFIDRRVKERMK